MKQSTPVTQADVDAAYFAWRMAVEDAYPTDGQPRALYATPQYVDRLWRKCCRLHEKLAAQNRKA